MEKEELQRQRILEASYKLFSTYGVKSITMDDIARELAMSKKTIYLYYNDKDDLVTQLMSTVLKTHQDEMSSCELKSKDPIHEIFLMLDQIEKMLRPVNPSMFYDLQKYHSNAWSLFEEFKNEYMYNCILKNLKKGVDHGIYRKEINLEILAHTRVIQVSSVFNPLYYPSTRFNISDVQYQLTEHFMHGVATLKGHKLINKYLQVTEEE
ncbi:TetR/AcrR family transcriptional regulator [Solitalea sp. MAHUQ-68]|uniref:TetR/AcrR family transcriptional regulator n=1 Tax=Solitalea agri TaxID=2953739 RepID=A0A9X2F9W1_9SPHI|nr:TetR/AcrR family transcriptional regulator [Solitalea agri]MCO4294528.1 TetR/AcrR family transcriptional regulator [Solitalea agri]